MKKKETESAAYDPQNDAEVGDVFADFGTIGGTDGSENSDIPTLNEDAPSLGTSSNVDQFRAQLDRIWGSPESLAISDIFDEERVETTSTSDGRTRAEMSVKRYRLASLFGDAPISTGPDMMDDVIAAVSANGKPYDNEDNIIILSPVSKEEMIAIRALVGQYMKTKKIILVNCKLDAPLPPELIGAETVYSILPLIAKSASRRIEDRDDPKVVVLRRFPRDWEIYVDVGDGFDLAASVPNSSVGGKQGPSMEWVSSAVKRYLQSR